jgi:hypothetical protein
MDGLGELLAGIAVTIVGVLIIAAALAATLVYFLDRPSCYARWAGSYETEWGFLSGCRVKVGDQWLPEKSVRKFQ